MGESFSTPTLIEAKVLSLETNEPCITYYYNAMARFVLFTFVVVAQPTIRDVRVPVVPGSASEESAREGVVNTQVPTMDEPCESLKF